MSSDIQQIRIGLTSNHACSYLPQQQERVAVALDGNLHNADDYEVLLANGFRRSGDAVYRPHCETCQSCEALRLSIPDFTPTRSQKRLLNKAAGFRYELKNELDSSWYQLYEPYICARHKGGSMYPPNRDEFEQFAYCSWMQSGFLHIYDDQDTLIAIAITDILSNSASAFYSFFDPTHPLSLGTIAVLMQIQLCQDTNKQWLYLGYQIDECPAMNYKTRFHRHQRLVNQLWRG